MDSQFGLRVLNPQLFILQLQTKFLNLKWRILPSFILLPSSVQVQYQFSPIWTEISFNPGYYTHPPPPTHEESSFEPLLDYLESLNLVWKPYSTKLGQLANP